MSEPQLIESGAALGKAGLVHTVSRPPGDGPHPTAVLIHGRGGDENVMWIFARTLPQPRHWLVVAPRGLLTDPDGGFGWHEYKPRVWPSLADFQAATTTLARFVASLPELYGADPGRTYSMGFSQGAAAAFALALEHPKLARGVAALMGFLPQGDPAGQPLAGLPVFMAAGLRDDRIPIEVARDSARRLRALGANLTHGEYPTAHKMNAGALRELSAWWRSVAGVPSGAAP
jgi:phospholipase/carboxylesterase